MPAAFQRGPCAASRSLNAPHAWVDCGDQPSSAMAGSRGKAMNSMFAEVRIVSVHSGASTPRTADEGTPDRYAPGVSAASWPSTSSRNWYVTSLLTHSELNPTSVPVYRGGATPLQLSCA